MNVYIKSLTYYLPQRVVTNEELVKEFPEWNAGKVSEKVGINQRHIASCDETAGDMAEKAAKKLFDEFKVSPEDIDFLLFCTQSPDYFLPTTACILQNRLGIPTSAGALDYNLGCSGYVYGLALAKGLIVSGVAKNVLLLTAETYSKYIHHLDKGNRSLFGDAAAATLISTDGLLKIGNFDFGTDGRGSDNLIVRTGAFRSPEKKNKQEIDGAGGLYSPDHLYMNGPEIFNFTLDAVPQLVSQTLSKNGMEKEYVDMFIFHQANKFMLNTIRRLCALPEEKFYINLVNTGNTVSSTLPIALKDAINERKIIQKMNILICGFGVGYSWGGCILSFE